MKKKILIILLFVVVSSVTYQKNFSQPQLPQMKFEIRYFDFPPQYKNSLDAFAYDYNADGFDDFILTSLIFPPTYPASYAPLHLLKSNGDCTFMDVTESAFGDAKMVHPRHFAKGDLNGDGLDDFVLAAHGTDTRPFPGELSRMFFNQQKKFLKDVTKGHLWSVENFTFHVSLGDVDQDGDLDIFLNNSGRIGPRIFMNKGDGNFTESVNNLPDFIFNNKKSFLGSLFFDADLDGDLDLMLGGFDGYEENHASPRDLLLINDGLGNFQVEDEKALPKRLYEPSWGTVSLASADFNQDGWPDIIASTHNHGFNKATVQLLLNKKKKKAQFEEASSNISSIENKGNFWIPWIEVGDINKDGKDDFIFNFRGPGNVGQHGKSFYLMLNQGNAKFVDGSELVPLKDPPVSTVRLVDCDGDRDLDIVFFLYGQGIYVAINVTKF